MIPPPYRDRLEEVAGEGKVRPLPGNSPHRRPVSRGIFWLWRICDDPFSATSFRLFSKSHTGRPVWRF